MQAGQEREKDRWDIDFNGGIYYICANAMGGIPIRPTSAILNENFITG